ncbi:MAG: hypothetical protein U0228_15555 [Myxococcaceae bacterium]
MFKSLKFFAVSLALGFTLAACGPEMTNTSTSSSQTCDEKHQCINGACTCTAGPKKDSSCCDPTDSSCTTNKCDTFCKYCM